MKNLRSAFTVAEILLALAVIGILTVILLPNRVSGTKAKAYKTLYKNTFKQIQEGFTMAANVYKHPFVFVANDTSATNAVGSKYSLDEFMKHHFNSKLVTRNPRKDALTIGEKDKVYSLKNGAQLIFPQSTLTIMDDTGCITNPENDGGWCMAWIDINGNKEPNVLAQCVVNSEIRDDWYIPRTCTVNEDKLVDIYPIFIKGNHISPATDAALTILNY